MAMLQSAVDVAETIEILARFSDPSPPNSALPPLLDGPSPSPSPAAAAPAPHIRTRPCELRSATAPASCPSRATARAPPSSHSPPPRLPWAKTTVPALAGPPLEGPAGKIIVPQPIRPVGSASLSGPSPLTPAALRLHSIQKAAGGGGV